MKKLVRIFSSICQSGNLGVSVVLAIMLAVPMLVSAQSTTATIIGTVSDPGGAQVPNASITARNVDTGLSRTVVSGEDGFYRIDTLPVGNYVIEVTATSGFKKARQNGVVLTVNQTVRADIALEVGGLNEEVTISEAPPEVNTVSPELGRTIQSQEIENLPLVERNIFALLDLTPGVQSNNAGISNTAQGNLPSTLGFPEQRTLINGGTDGGTGSVNYFLDGGTNMTNLRNTGNVAPNPEAVREFKITTNAYGAEYGRFASGIINIVTKSGTNKYNGSIYEYLRNDALNANEWNSVLEKAPYRRNQFGGTFGGPISRDRTFFFASYSGLRQNTSTFLSGATLPSAAFRTGDFSALAAASRPKDPTTGTTLANAAFFPGGIIPANRIDPVAARILRDYIPQSNFTNANGSLGYQANVPLPVKTDEILVKLDHQLNEPHRLSFTYFTNWGNQTFFPGSGNLPWATQDFKWRQSNVNLSDVWIISPNKINQIWGTYTRSFGGRLNNPETTLEDLGSTFRTQGKGSLPQITVNGFFTLSNAIGGPTAGTNLYSIRDVFSWTKGNHSLKIGGEMTLNKDIQDVLLNNYGVFAFNNTATGNAFADFLLGITSASTQDAPVTGYTNTWYMAGFVQDDYRVTPRLNLNLGLRWDVQTPPTDPLDRWTNYVPGKQSVVRPTAPLGLFSSAIPALSGAIAVRYGNISPRLGFALDPFGDGKTSIRASLGLFYGSIAGNEWNTMTNFQPASTRLNFTNRNRNGSGQTLANPYTNYVGGIPFPYNGTFTNGGGFFAVAPDFEFPRTLQTNVSIQRQITSQLTMGAAYIRSFARRLPFGRDVNAPVNTTNPIPSTSNVQARRPNQAFGSITVLDSDQSADYTGLQITGGMRFNKLFSANGFYTLSSTTSSVQLHNNTTQGLAQNYLDLAAEKGAADTDQRHVFSLSFNFQPDFYKGGNRFARGILNGWSISPIVKLRSGRPFTVTNGGVDANLDGVTGTDRAQLIGDPYLANPTAARWFNTAAFIRNLAVTGAPVDGNSPRNFLYGPGYKVVDLALSRDFRFGERMKLRLRGEGTNILNQVNYDQPNGAVPATPTTTSTFGSISSAKAMRIIQLGVRLTF